MVLETSWGTPTGWLVVRAGRFVGFVECDVIDEQERLVARASSTCMTLRGQLAEGRQLPSELTGQLTRQLEDGSNGADAGVAGSHRDPFKKSTETPISSEQCRRSETFPSEKSPCQAASANRDPIARSIRGSRTGCRYVILEFWRFNCGIDIAPSVN
jgi:hypothetical protein